MRVRRSLRFVVTCVIASCCLVGQRAQGQSISQERLQTAHRQILDRYLKQHLGLRLPTLADCRCAEQVKMQRESGKKDYDPYYTYGDFNGDGASDFAVVVIADTTSASARVLIFNGPFRAGVSAPAFDHSIGALRDANLFFPPPAAPNSRAILFGPFESEGSLIVAKGRTYALKQ